MFAEELPRRLIICLRRGNLVAKVTEVSAFAIHAKFRQPLLLLLVPAHALELRRVFAAIHAAHLAIPKMLLLLCPHEQIHQAAIQRVVVAVTDALIRARSRRHTRDETRQRRVQTVGPRQNHMPSADAFAALPPVPVASLDQW